MSVQQETNGQVATDVIQYEVVNGIATIWLNRPEVKNCINWELLMGLGEMLDRAEEDENARVVVIRGRGNTFCAGADLNMLDSEFLGTTNKSVKIAQVSARTFARAFDLGKPTIAVVEGYAVAGGFELAISCDFLIAADDAKIGDFHIRRALFGGAGPIYRLPRYIGVRRTKELLFTGKLLSGKECKEWDLANVSAPTEQLEEAIAAFVKPMLDKSAVHDADHEARRQPRSRRRHRDPDRPREHDLQRRAPVPGRQGGRAGIPGEARSRLEARLAPASQERGRARRAGAPWRRPARARRRL